MRSPNCSACMSTASQLPRRSRDEETSTSPAGFQKVVVASFATAINAPPMPMARAPPPRAMNSPAYFAPWDADGETGERGRCL